MAGDTARKQMNDLLNELQVKGDVYMKQLMLEQKRVNDLDDALKQATEQIRQYRAHTKQSAIDVLNLHRFTKKPAHTRADGLDPTKAADALQRRQVNILEVRLNKLKIRDAEAEHFNEKLKKDIDNLRKKRVVINESHAKYGEWLQETRQKIFDLMEKASTSHDERDKIIERRNELVQKAEEERRKFLEGYFRMSDFVDEQNHLFEECIADAAKGMQNKLKKAAKVMAQGKNPGAATLPSHEHHQAAGEGAEGGGGGPVDELDDVFNPDRPQHPLVARLKDLQAQNEAEQSAISSLNQRIRDYRSSFEDLKRVSGIDNVDELMTIFRKNEEETFSLFNYIQTVNQEIEWTLESHATLKEEMKAFEEKEKMDDGQRAEVIRLNNERLESTAKMNREAREGAQEVSIVVDRVAKKVQSLFFKLQCDQMEGGTEGETAAAGSNSAGGTGGSNGNNNGTKTLNGMTGTVSMKTGNGTMASTGSSGGKGGGAAGGGATGTGQRNKNGGDSERKMPMVALTGQAVNDSNVLEYMKVIEQRLVQIIHEYTKKLSKSDDSVSSIPIIGPSVPMNERPDNTCHHMIRAPDTMDDENDLEGGATGLLTLTPQATSQIGEGTTSTNNNTEKPIPISLLRKRFKERGSSLLPASFGGAKGEGGGGGGSTGSLLAINNTGGSYKTMGGGLLSPTAAGGNNNRVKIFPKVAVARNSEGDK